MAVYSAPLRTFTVLCVCALLVFSSCAKTRYHIPNGNSRRVYTGLETFVDREAKKYRGKRAALVTNHSGVDFALRKNIDLLREKGIEISLVLAPEHGLYGYENDYDKNIFHADDRLNAVIYNLHHLDADSLRSLLAVADVVIFDIQDLGMRCYTYISSLKLVMDALYGTNLELIVLDRPNPLGFLGVDGAFLDPVFYSKHISSFPAPFLYGMTIGEAARYYRGEYARKVRLRVITVSSYGRDMLYNRTMLPWIPPSPNLPTYESSIVYSGVVLLEGVNISLGRGTPKPFEYIGAPWIEPESFCEGLSRLGLKNFRFRPIYFSPTFSKYAGVRCGGAHILYAGEAFRPVEVSYRLLRFIKENYPQCRWEDFRGDYTVDFLAGTDLFRRYIDEGRSWKEFDKKTAPEVKMYMKKRSRYLIY